MNIEISFEKMMDNMTEFTEFDEELKDDIKWLDEQARKEGITFYQKAFNVLHQYDINQKARDWLRTRN